MSDWYYAADNEQKGPVNEAELKENLAANKIPPDTLVWKDGMESWTPANQVPAFSFRQPPIPAKVQPTTAAAPAAAAPKADPAINNPESTKPVDLAGVIGKPEALEVDAEDAEKNKVFGILAYVIFFVPLLVAKDSPFAKYHANQGLALFLTMLGTLIVLAVLSFIPFIGFIFGLLHIVVYLGYLVLVILGIVNAAAGKCVPLPVIGGIKLLK
ncbi:MAG: GYF domain-containing protein [Methylacidiphilales bacterium]|nr:GYF domain-containing protein [Candidatus Methylacidiphilales bacterium]